MPYTVVFSPEAQAQLVALYQYISLATSPEIAERYTEAIIAHCEGLQDFPQRGTRRDDVRPGLRHYQL
jgi:toxin ParE1/3/4